MSPSPIGGTFAEAPVAVVVVSYNSEAVIDACLRAAWANRPAEILVVDNHSSDRTEALVRGLGDADSGGPPIRFLPQASNLGFAAGCNLGVGCSQAPYVLFLNDDAVLQPNYLSLLCAALQQTPGAASATGKLLLPGVPPRIDSAGLRLDRYALRPTDRGQGEIDRGQYDKPERVFGPCGAAALYRRAALPADGAAFDARLFAYYEDVDLAWRLGNAGWSHLYEPAAVATHLRRGPGARPRSLQARAFVNRYRVWKKNEGWGRFLTYAPIALAWEGMRLLRLGIRQPRLLGAILRQAWEG